MKIDAQADARQKVLVVRRGLRPSPLERLGVLESLADLASDRELHVLAAPERNELDAIPRRSRSLRSTSLRADQSSSNRRSANAGRSGLVSGELFWAANETEPPVAHTHARNAPRQNDVLIAPRAGSIGGRSFDGNAAALARFAASCSRYMNSRRQSIRRALTTQNTRIATKLAMLRPARPHLILAHAIR